MDVATKSLKISQLLHSLIKRYYDQYPLKYDIDEIINTGVWEYTYPTHELKTEADKLIFSSLVTVTKAIFEQLIDLYDLSLKVSNEFLQSGKIHNIVDYELVYQEKNESMTELLKTLNWISFGYQCTKKCGMDEICFTPSWGPSPVGWTSIKERQNEDKSFKKQTEL